MTEKSTFHIPRNRIGQRIGPPIEVSQELVDRVKKKRVCKDSILEGNVVANIVTLTMAFWE